MFAIADVTSKKKDGTIASTSSKCVWDQFNNPRKRKPSPKKSSEMSFKKYRIEEKENDPPSVKKVKKSSYENKSKNHRVNEIRFKEKIQNCDVKAGWLNNFLPEPKRESPRPKDFLYIPYNYADHVNLKDEQIVQDMVSHITKLEKSECELIENDLQFF